MALLNKFLMFFVVLMFIASTIAQYGNGGSSSDAGGNAGGNAGMGMSMGGGAGAGSQAGGRSQGGSGYGLVTIGSGQSNALYNGGVGAAGQYTQINQGNQNQASKRKRRNSDSASNYVDRVRLRDPSKVSISANPCRTPGWRQKSLSNIDLTSSHKTNGVFRYRDFESIGICDLYSKTSGCAEYDDLYGVNPKAGSCHNNVLYDHRDEPELYAHETEACSLRRTRSLAIIREETFNDLRIKGARTRRSQLIPRARLVDRSFFKDRFNFLYDGSCSGLDTLTSETQDTDSQYSTTKRQKNRIQPQYPWQQDRSDLESIDSSIFKNSQHQNGIERSNSLQSSVRATRADIHCVNNDTLGVSKDLSKSRTNLDAHIKLLEKISLPDDNSSTLTKKNRFSEDYSIKEENGSGITVIEIKGSNISIAKEPSVISYDSIYLSSESSEGKQTVFEDPNCSAHRSTESDLIAISIEVYDDLGQAPSKFEQADETTIDTLYSQVTKPKIIETIPKRQIVPSFIRSVPIRDTTSTQYSSLPNAEIDNILRKSERIDAKLRFSYQENGPLLEEPIPDYDTVQRPQQALPTIPASGPASIEESDKGAPSIELIKCSTKDFEGSTKVFIEELGLEIDYENSVVDISDPDSDIASIDPPPSVTLGGKKVIVDEVAAKAIKRSESGVKQLKSKETSAENIYDEVINIVDDTPSNRIFRPIEVFKSTYFNLNTNKNIKNEEKQIITEEKSNETDDKPITVIKVTSFDRRNSEAISKKANVIKLATFSSLIKDAAEKMPRPQLLQIVEKSKGSKDKSSTSTTSESKAEFLHRVNSVHTYWSKILEEVQNTDDIKSISEETDSRRTSIESSQNSSSYFTAKTHQTDGGSNNDFQSFCPSVEIVELDGQKKAAIVKAKNFDEVDFDHVRYRVIKSDVFQKQMIINNRKEAQFDGLLQYLQDYSFQELLANNNVVIIEPVRTSQIEKPSEKKPIEHSIHCKITGGAGGHKKNALKQQNFFYHPIRVNKELLDEELPSPDTVRNVRSMFEHRFGLGVAKRATTADDSKINTRNTDTLRKKALRYLSIDQSSFNDARKWDSASLSSGVSSGDLSSPCECNEDARGREGHQMYASAENLCQNGDEEMGDEFESHYVSQDILEKIRERGETITYYGGRVLNKKDGKVSAMTKAIMNEINNHQNSVFKKHENDEYLGMKFKLIKSNSCSSRLELAGTGKLPPDLEHPNRYYMSPSPVEAVAEENEEDLENEEMPPPQETTAEEEIEETVRDIVSKLEHKSSINSHVTTPNNRPRIVEFHPKVKVVNSNNSTSSVTINSQPIEHHAITKPNQSPDSKPVEPTKIDVTVNNHITYASSVTEPSQRLQQRIDEASARASKICRNKDVDLAFSVAHNPLVLEKKSLEKTNSIDSFHKQRQQIPDELDTTPTQLKNNNYKNNEKEYDSLDDDDDDRDNNSNSSEDEDSDTLVYKISNCNSSDSNKSHVNKKTDTKTPPKVVSWTTIGKFDEKLYCVNDKTLIEKKRYNEMEFEEFEVFDPALHVNEKDDAEVSTNGN